MCFKINGRHRLPLTVDRPVRDCRAATGDQTIGSFKGLWQVAHFHNTRDAKPVCEDLGINDATVDVARANDRRPEPEVAANLNTDELGDLGLTTEQELAPVAFMMSMIDGYPAKQP